MFPMFLLKGQGRDIWMGLKAHLHEIFDFAPPGSRDWYPRLFYAYKYEFAKIFGIKDHSKDYQISKSYFFVKLQQNSWFSLWFLGAVVHIHAVFWCPFKHCVENNSFWLFEIIWAHLPNTQNEFCAYTENTRNESVCILEYVEWMCTYSEKMPSEVNLHNKIWLCIFVEYTEWIWCIVRIHGTNLYVLYTEMT